MKKNIRKIKTPGESTVKTLFKFGQFALTKPGFDHLKKAAGRLAGIGGKEQIPYDLWIKAQTDIHKLRADYEETINTFATQPKFSIILTLNDPSVSLLNSSLHSVGEQLYPDWEHCIAYDIAAPHEIPDNFRKDARIQMIPVSGSKQRSTLLNEALAKTTGNYILFLEQGDVLTPNSLFEFIKHINTHREDQLIYADEDKVDDNGNFSFPRFKPGWSPDSLLSGNYIGHPFIISKDLIGQLNGFRQGFDGSEAYDLLLRATEITGTAGHIPKVLYHSRSNIARIQDSSKKAIDDALMRRSIPGDAISVNGLPCAFNIDYKITKPEKVSIIIPTKDHAQLLKKAIDSIIAKTDYPDYEIIVINNNSVSKEFFEFAKEYEQQHPGKFRCINANFPFNFSKLINLGVSVSNGKYVLMLNNDIEAIHSDWMTKMVSFAQHEKTGAVGAKLLFPDNTIQHAGVILESDEASRHVYANADRNDSRVMCVANYSAVTGACLMCRKEIYNEVGGMDEQLPVEYNDIDLCLKMLSKGYNNVYLPMVELYHHESATRGHPFRSKKAWKQHVSDLAVFKSKWQKIIDNDPYYNPNFKAGIEGIYV